jgi:hypothetical protein
MRKALIIIISALLLVSGAVFAQQVEVDEVGDPNPNTIGVDAAQQRLREVSVSKFEDAGFWLAHMSPDQGIVTMRRFAGSPADKEPLEGEVEAGLEITDEYVIGLKVQFYSRGYREFSIEPIRPIPIEGSTKTISVWVVGRNFNHTLKVIVSDFFGNYQEITMGKLNFSGWQELTVAIPPQLRQSDYHFSQKNGISILGFKVETDPTESYGSYYIYFDGLRAVTDLFQAESRDRDDMPDSW